MTSAGAPVDVHSPAAAAAALWWTISSSPYSAAMRSRCASIAAKSQPVAMCRNGNGGGAGQNALRARCSITELSLPIEYRNTGRRASATTSRKMWMLSASRRARWVRSVIIAPG